MAASLIPSPGYGVVGSRLRPYVDRREQSSTTGTDGKWLAMRIATPSALNGAVETSKLIARIPVGLGGAFGVIDAAIVSGSAAPLLLGRPSLKKLNVKLERWAR